MLDALNGLFERIADLMESERRFTADAAHELRTPIAAIRAQAQVALVEADDAIAPPCAATPRWKGCDRATRLVEQLLTLSRLEAGARSEADPGGPERAGSARGGRGGAAGDRRSSRRSRSTPPSRARCEGDADAAGGAGAQPRRQRDPLQPAERAREGRRGEAAGACPAEGRGQRAGPDRPGHGAARRALLPGPRQRGKRQRIGLVDRAAHRGRAPGRGSCWTVEAFSADWRSRSIGPRRRLPSPSGRKAGDEGGRCDATCFGSAACASISLTLTLSPREREQRTARALLQLEAWRKRGAPHPNPLPEGEGTAHRTCTAST